MSLTAITVTVQTPTVASTAVTVAGGSAPAVPSTAVAVAAGSAPSVPSTAIAASASAAPTAPATAVATTQLPAGFGALNYFAAGVLYHEHTPGMSQYVVLGSTAITADGRISIDIGEDLSPWASASHRFWVATQAGVVYRMDTIDAGTEGMPYTYEFGNFAPGTLPPTAATVTATAVTAASSAVAVSTIEPIAVETPITSNLTPIDPTIPTPIVVVGEQPPVNQTQAPYADAVQLTHTDTVPDDAHSYVSVGSRATTVTINLPASPALYLNVWVADSSGQAATHAITVDAGANQIDNYGTQFPISNNYAVLHIRWDGTRWKVL